MCLRSDWIDLLDSFIVDLPVSLTHAAQGNDGDAQKCKRVQKVIKLYCEQVTKILEDSGCIPEDDLIGLLRAVSTNSSLLKEYPLLRKRIIKAIVVIWSSWLSDSVRVVALLALHHLCSQYNKVYETCLKSMYQQYGKSCRSLSAHNMGQASLMLNGLVEIFALYPSKAVDFSTRCLRRLASLIQQATKKPIKDHVRKVLCWQFISLVRFWSHLVSIQSSDGPFKVLIHPICNMLICLLSFQFSPRYFGFHFHCIAASLEMTEKLRVHIPVLSCLLKIVEHVTKQPLYKMEMKKPAYDLVALYKVPKSETITKGYLECVADEALFHILKLLVIQSSEVTFPEHALSVISPLKTIINTSQKIDRNLKKQVEGHLSKVIQQKKAIDLYRNSQSITPASIALGRSPSVVPDSKRTLGEYVVNLEKVRNIKRRLLINKDEEVLTKKEEDKPDIKTAKKKPKVELPDTKKRKKKLVSNVNVIKKNKRSTVPNDDQDILEDFVLDE